MTLEPRLLDAPELAAILGLQLTSVWRYCREGCLHHYRLGRRVLFDLEEVKQELREAVRQ